MSSSKRAVLNRRAWLPLLAVMVGIGVSACPPPVPVDAGKDAEPDSARRDAAMEGAAPDDVSIDVPTSEDVFDSGVAMDSSNGSDVIDAAASPDVVDSGVAVDTGVRADVVDSGSAADAAVDARDAAGLDATTLGDASAPDVIVRDSSYTDVFRSGDARVDMCGPTLWTVAAAASEQFSMGAALIQMASVPLPCIDPALATYPSGGNSSVRLQIATASQVTVAPSRGSVYSGVVHAIAQDCAAPNPACIVAARFPSIITEFLPPGTYEIQKWGGGSTTVYVEPPVATPTNTRCDTAVNVGFGSFTSAGPRVLDSQSRFVRYRSDAFSAGTRVGVVVQSETTTNYGTVVVRRGCGATATEVARADNVPLILNTITFNPANDTDYFIEFSGITIGSRFSVSLERLF